MKIIFLEVGVISLIVDVSQLLPLRSFFLVTHKNYSVKEVYAIQGLLFSRLIVFPPHALPGHSHWALLMWQTVSDASHYKSFTMSFLLFHILKFLLVQRKLSPQKYKHRLI